MDFLSLTSLQWTGAAFAALLIGVTKAGFGSGAGIVAVPLMTLALGAENMLPVLLPLLITGDLFSVIRYPKEIDRRNVQILVPACLLGVAAGSFLLYLLLNRTNGNGTTSTGSILNPLVGGICIFFVCVQLWRFFREWRLTELAEPYRPKVWHGLVLGTTAGITSTLSHAAGPLIALFLLPQKLDKKVFVGTSVSYFFFGNLIKFIPYSFQGLFDAPILKTSLVLIPAVIVGTFIGVALNKRMPTRSFTLIIYIVTLVTGVKLIFS